jgi:cell wall-associated NlpC family hydrolase
MLLTRRQTLGILSAAAIPSLPASLAAAEDLHVVRDSGYSLHFNYSADELIGDLRHTERGDPHRQSHTPHRHWYSHHIRRTMGAWGPGARTYASLADLDDRPLEWRRERVIATASRFLGYAYQHHHIPDWDPPAHWPWKPCCAGHNGKGVDCSNFTSFVYNQGFGIKFSSGIKEQSRIHTAIEGGDERIGVKTVELPASYAERKKILRTGDLLYIRHNQESHVSHVILWIGDIGHSPSGVPLIMDSHGGEVVNDEGHHIPCGIHLRPFREGEWYDRCASHAHRVF